MPIYDYRCGCGLRFERLVPSSGSAPPDCPQCGDPTSRVPSTFAIGGRASPGLSQEEMPQTWRGTNNGDREYLGQLQRQWDRRQRLEEKYPELQGDRRPIIAHEGRYEGAPLRVGDPVPGADTGHAHSHAGQGHSHGHGHGPSGGHGQAGAADSSPERKKSGPAE